MSTNVVLGEKSILVTNALAYWTKSFMKFVHFRQEKMRQDLNICSKNEKKWMPLVSNIAREQRHSA